MALMCITALIIFYIWPTAVPVANIDWSHYPNVDFLKKVDASGNACPSLHVATAIFSAKLYSESERKLTTIQSFLNLLTTS